MMLWAKAGSGIFTFDMKVFLLSRGAEISYIKVNGKSYECYLDRLH